MNFGRPVLFLCSFKFVEVLWVLLCGVVGLAFRIYCLLFLGLLFSWFIFVFLFVLSLVLFLSLSVSLV